MTARKELIKLAKKIKDTELRKKVVEFIKNPKLTSKDFTKYKPEDLEKAGSIFVVSGPTSMGPIERDVLRHTIILTELVEIVADFVKEKFDIPLNKDYMIAAAILHDMMKIFEFRRDEKGELQHTGIMLDHTMLAVAEFYKRGLPEDVIHIIAAHAGEAGTTPPRSFEALIFHYLDSLVSLVEYYLYGKMQQMIAQQMVQEGKVMAISEDELKKMFGEEAEKKE